MDATIFQETFYGNTIGQWTAAVGVVLLVLFGVRLVLQLVVRRVMALAERTDNQIDDLVAKLLDKTKFLILLLLGIWAGAHTLTLNPEIDQVVRGVMVIGLLLQVAIWGAAVIDYFLDRYQAQQLEVDPDGAMAVGAMGFLARLILWSVIALMALDNLGIDITALVAGLGVGGIAVALAVQNILGDLFSSLSIVMDKPFVLGDFIIVGEFMGTVEHVGLKTTRIRALGGEQLVFANSDLLSSRVRNYKRMDERRIVFEFGVLYGTPHEQVETIPKMVQEIVEAQEDTRFDRTHFKKFGDSALVFEVVYYMLVPDYAAYMDVQQEINLALYRRFEAEGIDFAFPTRTVHLHSGSPASPAEPAPRSS